MRNRGQTTFLRKAAEIHDVIDALPEGGRTGICERGIGLIGGQRLAIARTINTPKGKVTMIFITHQIPKGLHVDEVIALGEHGARMGVVGERDAFGEGG